MTPTMLIFFAQTPPSVPPPDASIPVWWWVIIAAMGSVIATLAGLYKKARDREVEAEKSKVALIQQVGDKTSDLLERAIEAFTLNKTGNEQLTGKLHELTNGLKDLRQEVRRVGEKIDRS
jgi:hypothetical protein